MSLSTSGWVIAYGGLALVALVPIVWAIVDVVRRPAWQFSTGRKVLWVSTLVVGWVVLPPLALVSALVYLFVFRQRFPPVAAKPSMAVWDPYASTAGGRPPPVPPAGWYTDPSGRPGERWWDGKGWSDHIR